jgi:DNA-binding NarL/FixJ family response regulator
MRFKRLIIADNHSVMRLGMRTMIETRPNLEVVGEAGTGREALSVALDTSPDMAIIDYTLPELNGCELTHRLKKVLPRLQVLIYTLYDREEMIVDALRAGAKGYVLKSDSERQLFAAIESILAGRTYFSEAIPEPLVVRFKGGKYEPTANPLTHREREVVQLVAEGKINKEIAIMLNVSIKTVETHRASAMVKLNLRTRSELVRYALRNKIVEA